MARMILVATRTFGKYSKEPVEYLKEHGFELIRVESREELEKFVEDADAMIVGTMKVDRSIIERAKKLKIIAKHGVGTDNIDLESATEFGVPVVIVKETNSESVAELVIGFIFTLSRRLIQAHNDLYFSKSWKDWMGYEISGKTLGIVGYGSIGKKVALKAHCLGMKILATDPKVRYFPDWVENVSLEDLLRRSDFVTLHVPLYDSTKGMIGYEELKLMKRSAFLINTSRGGVVNERDLVKAVEEGEISGAALDVFEEEPPYDSPVFSCEKIVTTPHIGSHTHEAVFRMGMSVAKSIVEFFNGSIPEGIVNPEALRGE